MSIGEIILGMAIFWAIAEIVIFIFEDGGDA